MSKEVPVLVELVTKPKISYSFEGVVNTIHEIDELVKISELTPEKVTLEDWKTLRKTLNSEFDKIDSARLELQKLYMTEFDVFKEEYDRIVKGPKDKNSAIIQGYIAKGEKLVVENKTKEMIAYAEEYAVSLDLNLGTITLDKLGVRFTPAEELGPIRKRVVAAIDNISKEVNAIKTMNHSESILEEYLVNYDMAAAVSKVNEALRIAEAARVKEAERLAALNVPKPEPIVERVIPEVRVEPVIPSYTPPVKPKVEEFEEYTFTLLATEEMMFKVVDYIEELGARILEEEE